MKSKKNIKRPLHQKIRSYIRYFLISILGLIVIALLLMQTHFFKEILREEIISKVNAIINGKLNIERIEGTIITSLDLYNTSIVNNKDTLFFAEKIELNYNPFSLLLKIISIDEILISDAQINLLQDKNGNWNYEKIFGKPTEEVSVKKEADSLFGFDIKLNKFKIQNTSFLRQTNENLFSEKRYDYFNFDDLRIRNFNFQSMVFAD
ncbi:MAG: AsmA family protein, partial [Ignavibacteriales bacterium]|nr:AsmA family protein [Ignavibacteriales bacterium]